MLSKQQHIRLFLLNCEQLVYAYKTSLKLQNRLLLYSTPVIYRYLNVDYVRLKLHSASTIP